MLKEILDSIKRELKETPRIVIFEEEEETKELIEEALKYHGVEEIKFVQNEEELFLFLSKVCPTVLVYSFCGNFQEVIANINQIKSLFPKLKLFCLAPYDDEVDLARLFFFGADEAIQKPFSMGEFIARLTKLLRTYYLEKKVEQLLVEDPLTFAYNRRFFEASIREEALRALRYGFPLSLVMIDLDKFKHYNDTYGHAEGDKVLQGIAVLLCENMRLKVDKVCRYGGDEFVIILPHTDWKKALVVVKRIIKAYEKNPFEPVTLSFGIASLIDRGDLERSVSDLIIRADSAMYQAKKMPGNTFVIDPETIIASSKEEAPLVVQPSPRLQQPHPQD
jgi:two-component system cell cycle response regulator